MTLSFERNVLCKAPEIDYEGLAPVVCFYYVTECYDRTLPGMFAPPEHYRAGEWLPRPENVSDSRRFAARIAAELGLRGANYAAWQRHRREVGDYSFEELNRTMERLTELKHVICDRPVKDPR